MTQLYPPNYGAETQVIDEESRHLAEARRANPGWWFAALCGMFTAFGVLVVVGGLAAIAGIPYQLNTVDPDGAVITDLTMAGVLLASLAVLVAFYIGGWVATRTSRSDGIHAGVGAALWALLFVAVSSALGVFVDQQYNLLLQIGLPNWVAEMRVSDFTGLVVLSFVAGILAMFLGAILGANSATRENGRLALAQEGVTTTAARPTPGR